MTWRLAKSLDKLRAQIDAAYPARSKSSDGTIGDARHAATKSEHNPDANGVVRALDITNDPAHGVSARAIADALVASRDSRILYVISNAQINSSVVEPWKWRPYSGSNAHRQHVHISVVADPKLYDDARPWPLPRAPKMTPVVTPAAAPSKRFTGITATVFADPAVAYSDVKEGCNDRPGVALPFKFRNKRPKVRVFYAHKSVICEVIDVGPWNIDDDYWNASHGRPQAETGRDRRGRVTNLAGIDLTHAAARTLGLPGKGKVDWEFIAAAGAVGKTVEVGAPVIVVAGGTKAAAEAQKAGWSPIEIGMLFIGSVALALGAWLLVRRWYRNNVIPID